MRKLLALSVTLFFVLLDVQGDEWTHPFDIPPHNKPALLLGDIKLEAPTAMAFDSKNRPYLINNRNPTSFGLIRTVRNGEWVTVSLRPVLADGKQLTKRNLHAPGELVIDDADALYATIAETLIYSPDLGKTFKAYRCRGSLELRVGPNRLSAPPAICSTTGMRYVDRGKEQERDMAWWAKRGTLSVLLPTKDKEKLELGAPIEISDNCQAAGSGGHSGGTSFAVTTARKTHLVYAELPKDVRNGGNPIYIATVDRETRTVVAREHLIVAPPQKADVHTRPTITVDSRGYLHVLSGSHGQPFFYLRSLKPNDITGGWTKPVRLTGRPCYASIVCDEHDRLHSVYRDWLPPPTLGYAAASAVDGKWGKSTTLVHGATLKKKNEYGIFYHRLFIDRASNLYVSFTFFEFGTGDKGNYPEALMVSKDEGKTWLLARKDTFLANMDGE